MITFTRFLIFTQLFLVVTMVVLLHHIWTIESNLSYFIRRFQEYQYLQDSRMMGQAPVNRWLEPPAHPASRKGPPGQDPVEKRSDSHRDINVQLQPEEINNPLDMKITVPTQAAVAMAQLDPLPPNTLTYLPKLDGENVISMSLWGTAPRYTMGAIKNVETAKDYFPGWKVRIYVELPSDQPKYGSVSKDILDKLRSLGAEIFFMDPSDTHIPPMMWRFLVADDLTVDRFLVRDVDSRLSARDAASVYLWTKTDKPFHCVRDHPSHAGYSISGGMWGGRPAGLRDVLRRHWKDIMYGYRTDYFQDMGFLMNVIWPRVKAHAFCVDSVSCDRWEGAVAFPIPRYEYEHVGQVFNEQEMARPEDVRILSRTGENLKCSPPRPEMYNKAKAALEKQQNSTAVILEN